MKLKSMIGYTPPAHGGGWQHKLKALMATHNHMKSNGRGHASLQSQKDRSDRLYRIFNALTKDLKFGLEDPANLKPKHIEALVEHWLKKELSPSTIENNLSLLRLFCTWVNKKGMVKAMADYAPGVRRTYAAQVDRSPQANGIDFWKLWDLVYEKDQNVAMQLLLVMGFGARRKEAVMFMPLVRDKGGYVELVAGTKGGKPRTVPIDSDLKRQVMAALKNFVIKKHRHAKAHIGDPNCTLEQNLKRYSYVLGTCGMTKKELGFTGHSFRQEYLNDELERRGLIPTIRGGDGKAATKLETDIAYLQVSEQAGHGRKSVMPAYAGALIVKKLIPEGTVSAPVTTASGSDTGTAMEEQQ